MKLIKKLILTLIFTLLGFAATNCLAGGASDGYATFNSNFRNAIYRDNGEGASVYDFSNTINPMGSFKDNIMNMFYPTSGGRIWDTLRNVGVGILVVFLVRAGFLLLFSADKDADLKKARLNFVYILFGAFLFFGAVWILGTALQVGTFQGTQGQYGIVSILQNNLLLQVLSFLKAAAFFVAILMIIYYGFQIIQAYEKEDKIKSARKGVINVAIALIFIKVIDYVYFIAQTGEFKNRASELITSVSKVMGYALGILMVLSVFYAGTLLITSSGSEDKWKKAKSIVTTIFLVSVIVMLFLLIAHQVITELT